MVTSADYVWTDEPGLLLVKRWIRRHPLPVVEVPVRLPPWGFQQLFEWEDRRNSRSMRTSDPSFPLILIPWANYPLDGNHRLYRAGKLGQKSMPAVILPWWFFAWGYCVWFLYPAEGLYLGIRSVVRSFRREATRS
jgi:hypothetical protein